MKRFIDTTIWTQNKWFRKLKPEIKIFWFYIISNCDSVGVWEEDLELASFIIGYDYNREKLIENLSNRITIINNKKWWVVDFCIFQYGILQDNLKNKPHASYLNLLRKHSLYEDYVKTIGSLKEKEQEKEQDKDKEKEQEKSKNKETEKWHNDLWESYPRKEGKREAYAHLRASIKSFSDYEDCKKSIKNYTEKVASKCSDTQYIKMGSTFFNNWRDYVDWEDLQPVRNPNRVPRDIVPTH